MYKNNNINNKNIYSNIGNEVIKLFRALLIPPHVQLYKYNTKKTQLFSSITRTRKRKKNKTERQLTV